MVQSRESQKAMFAKRFTITNKKDYDDLRGLVLAGFNFEALDQFPERNKDEKNTILKLSKKYNFNPRVNVEHLSDFDERRRKALVEMKSK